VARDAVGNSSSTPPAGTVTVPCADATPPSDPTGLAASSVTETSVHLTWNPSNDNFGVDHYRVYYNSFVVGIPAGTAFDVTNMQCGEDADIEVTALDASGNESDADEISVEMDDCVDTSPPTAPTGLAVDQLKSFSLRLSWNPSSDNLGVTGYDVLVGGVRVRAGVGSPQTINLVCEQSYSLVVVSRDSSGNKAASSPLPVTMPECPGPSGVAMPTTNLPGWNLIFNDDFTVDAPTGSMGSESDPEKIIYVGAGNRKWVTYPETYKDTYQKRPYRSDEVLSVHDGMMDFHLRNVDGQPAGANPSPVITGDSQYQTYGRYSARLKIDNTDLSEYYMAWLLWPRDEALWENGESDYPEGSLYAGNFGVGGFAHYGPGQQEAFHAPSVNMHDWHTYTQEWTPTARRYYVDDVLIHTTSTPVYSGPERWQLQTETNGFGTHQGHLTLDWVAVYSYAP
jgi:hypothetical protein